MEKCKNCNKFSRLRSALENAAICVPCYEDEVSRLEAELKALKEKEPGQEKATDGRADTDNRDASTVSTTSGRPSAPETPAPLMICDKVQESCHCWHGTPHVWMGGIYGGCNLSCYKGRDRSMCVPIKAPSKEGKK